MSRTEIDTSATRAHTCAACAREVTERRNVGSLSSCELWCPDRHDALCGLPCSGGAVVAAGAHQNGEYHHNAIECPRCGPSQEIRQRVRELRERAAELESGMRMREMDLLVLRAELARLQALINTPRTDEFFAAVQLEAAHQIERWPAAHDAGKADSDWFWLIGYLAGKALRGDEKRLHHIITTAAAALNWWRHATGVSTAMRPGIAEPESTASQGAPP